MGSLAIFASALIAFNLYRNTLERNAHEDKYAQSEKFLSESIKTLERAYEIFTSNGSSPPENCRLLWLTTARMLIRYETIKENITADPHKDILEEYEEYWRFRFYQILDANKENMTLEYFMKGGEPYSGNNVARNSIAVIFAFSRWKESKEDPMRSVDDKALFAAGSVPIDFLGVESYISQYQKYWEDIQGMKNAGEGE